MLPLCYRMSQESAHLWVCAWQGENTCDALGQWGRSPLPCQIAIGLSSNSSVLLAVVCAAHLPEAYRQVTFSSESYTILCSNTLHEGVQKRMNGRSNLQG